MALALRAACSPYTHLSVFSQVLGNNCCTASKHAHAGKSPSLAVPDTPASSLRSSASPGLGWVWKINVSVESSVPFGLAKAGASGCCWHPCPREAPGLCGVCCKAEPDALEGQRWDACTALSLKLLLLTAPFHKLSLQLQLWKKVVCFLTQLAAKIMEMTVALTAYLATSRYLLVSGWVMESHTSSCVCHSWGSSWGHNIWQDRGGV